MARSYSFAFWKFFDRMEEIHCHVWKVNLGRDVWLQIMWLTSSVKQDILAPQGSSSTKQGVILILLTYVLTSIWPGRCCRQTTSYSKYIQSNHIIFTYSTRLSFLLPSHSHSLCPAHHPVHAGVGVRSPRRPAGVPHQQEAWVSLSVCLSVLSVFVLVKLCAGSIYKYA